MCRWQSLKCEVSAPAAIGPASIVEEVKKHYRRCWSESVFWNVLSVILQTGFQILETTFSKVGHFAFIHFTNCVVPLENWKIIVVDWLLLWICQLRQSWTAMPNMYYIVIC